MGMFCTLNARMSTGCDTALVSQLAITGITEYVIHGISILFLQVHMSLCTLVVTLHYSFPIGYHWDN